MIMPRIKTIVTGHTAMLWLLLTCGSAPARAQSVQGDPTDLRFEVRNATNDSPGTIDRLTIEYLRGQRNGILDFAPTGSSFIAPGVPVKEIGRYIVTAWAHDVPYWWSLRGRTLLAGPTTLYVFDTTNQRDDVTIKGLNLVLRHQGSLLQLEYMLQVENQNTPQRTVLGTTATFEIYFPAGCEQITATYLRGPDPTPFPATTNGTDRLSLGVPLTPGANHIQITASVPWHQGLEIPVGSNLPIASWSVLSAPTWLAVQALELTTCDQKTAPGFSRWPGPALAADRRVNLKLLAEEHQAGTAENLFSAPAADTAETVAPPEKTKGSSLPLVFGGLLVIIVIVVASRRRRR